MVLSQEQGGGLGENQFHGGKDACVLCNKWQPMGSHRRRLKTAALEWLRIEGVHDDDTNEADYGREELQLGIRAAVVAFSGSGANRLLVRNA